MSEKALENGSFPKEAVANLCGAPEEATFFFSRRSLQLNGYIGILCV